MADAPGIKPFSQVDYDRKKLVPDFISAANEVAAGATPLKTFGLDSWTDFELAIDRDRGFEAKLQSAGPVKAFELADKRAYFERAVLNPAFTGPIRCHFVVTRPREEPVGRPGDRRQGP
jgi:hypothetical protein